jgi:hypothetical protein
MDRNDLVRRETRNGSFLARELRLGLEPMRMRVGSLLARAVAPHDARTDMDRRLESSGNEVNGTRDAEAAVAVNKVYACGMCALVWRTTRGSTGYSLRAQAPKLTTFESLDTSKQRDARKRQ